MIGLLGTFAKFQKATIVFAIYLFVRPSVHPHGTKGSQWMDFRKIWYLSIVWTSIGKSLSKI